MSYYGDDELGPGEVEWYPPSEEEPPLDVEEVEPPHQTEPYEEVVGHMPPDYRNSKRPGSDPYDEGGMRRAIDIPCVDWDKEIKGCGAQPNSRCININRAVPGERRVPCLARMKAAEKSW